MRATKTGENDAYLSILTKEKGRFGLLSKGARSIKGEKLSISQIFTYANFEYYTRGEVNILKGGSVNKSFFGISGRYDGMTLGFYLCDLACEVSDENVESGELLRLLLNSLYALSEGLYDEATIKAAFELRAMALSGYAPTLDACFACGEAAADELYFNVEGGALVCRDCLAKTRIVRPSDYDDVRVAQTLIPISKATLGAMRYCVEGPLSRIFAFHLEEPEDMASLCKIAESYVLSHLERGFGTLEFYHAEQPSIEEFIKKGDAPTS